MAKKYYLTRKDRDGLREMAKKLRAGKVSGRPVPTRRRNSGGGIGSHFQIVRGSATAAVDVSDVAFQIESIAAYEEHSSTPDAPLWVAAPSGGVELAEGDVVWAIYRAGVLTFDPGGGDVVVDWLMFEPGSSNTPPLREFALQATKDLSDTTASVKWLDHTQAEVGDALNIYDPDQRFSGKAVNYVGSERAFRGLALLRTDLAGETADRWEIIAMERFAEWVIVEWDQSGSDWLLVADAFGGDEWNNRRPAANAGILSVSDPAGLKSTPSDTEKAIGRLLDPDGPTYQLHGVKGADSGGLRLALVTTSIAGATVDGTDLEAGVGSADVFSGDPTTGTIDLTTGASETVYNFYATAVPAGPRIVWLRGNVIVNVDCELTDYEEE